MPEPATPNTDPADLALARERIARLAAATRTAVGQWNTIHVDVDVNTLSASYRCTADRAPIDDTAWLRTGRIVDTRGDHYDTSGKPIGRPAGWPR